MLILPSGLGNMSTLGVLRVTDIFKIFTILTILFAQKNVQKRLSNLLLRLVFV